MRTGTVLFPRENNIQWLRLFFAVQVVLVHAIDKFWKIDTNIPRYFPGVPAFFFVSGFLIYSSWKNSPGLPYLQNRFLRLFPGLLFVTCGGLALVLYVRGFGDLLFHPLIYITWFVGQTTLGQWYNPDIFRNVGIGVIDGALWTITTEIIFYICVPVIVFFENSFKYTVIVLTAFSYSIYIFGPRYFSYVGYHGKSLFEILSLTPLVWGWMFGLGILSVKYFRNLQPYLPYFPLAIVVMAALIYYGKFNDAIFGCTGNYLGILYFTPYCAMILYFAFIRPFRTLHADFSYGIYVWHMPVLNLMVILGVTSAVVFLLAVAAMGVVSWYMVEQPCLRLKQRTIHRA